MYPVAPLVRESGTTTAPLPERYPDVLTLWRFPISWRSGAAGGRLGPVFETIIAGYDGAKWSATAVRRWCR